MSVVTIRYEAKVHVLVLHTQTGQEADDDRVTVVELQDELSLHYSIHTHTLQYTTIITNFQTLDFN